MKPATMRSQPKPGVVTATPGSMRKPNMSSVNAAVAAAARAAAAGMRLKGSSTGLGHPHSRGPMLHPGGHVKARPTMSSAAAKKKHAMELVSLPFTPSFFAF